MNYSARESFAKNLRKYANRNGKTQADIAAHMKVSSSTVSDWFNGVKYPRPDKMQKLADYFGILMSDLQRSEDEFISPTVTEDVVVFPVIGEVAAGFEHIAVEDWTGDKIEVPRSMLHGRKKEDFFVLSVVGDSMYPLYLPGDKVLVLKQSTVNHPGDVGVIRYDGDKASLKKLEYAAGENWLRMVPINPLYPPQTITGADLERCEIIGIPTLLVREIK